VLGTRRCAPRTLRAWCRAAQPLDAIAASRYARGADGMDALRARAPACVPPPITRALPLSGEDVEDVVGFALCSRALCKARFALLPRARVWGGVFQTSSCTSVRGNACMLPQHVQCESARRATATGAPYPQARPIPRTLSA
jgi:hypothetical protein